MPAPSPKHPANRLTERPPQRHTEQYAARIKLIKELFRKSMHIPFVLAAALVSRAPQYNRPAELALVGLGILYYILEQLRMKSVHIPLLSRIQKIALRENENARFAYAPLTLLLGISLSMELYIQPVAIASIIAVTIGDAFAAIAGTALPRTPRVLWNKKKTYAGMLANAVSVGAVCAFFFDSWTVIIITAVSSALVESLDLEHVDNIVVPLFVGAMLYLTVF